MGLFVCLFDMVCLWLLCRVVLCCCVVDMQFVQLCVCVCLFVCVCVCVCWCVDGRRGGWWVLVEIHSQRPDMTKSWFRAACLGL